MKGPRALGCALVIGLASVVPQRSAEARIDHTENVDGKHARLLRDAEEVRRLEKALKDVQNVQRIIVQEWIDQWQRWKDIWNNPNPQAPGVQPMIK